MSREIYISLDVEADGRIPGLNSMLSFGAAAFDPRSPDPRKPIATFEANLETLAESTGDKDTLAWWATQPEAWAACRKDPRQPEEVMPKFVAWLRSLPGKPVVMGYPITYDFMWVYWYMMAFGGEGGQPMAQTGERSPFSHSGIDLKTMAWERLSGDYAAATKRNMPKSWFKGAPHHNHTALQDAIGQGVLFINMVLNETF